jgi:hypothetical protein
MRSLTPILSHWSVNCAGVARRAGSDHYEILLPSLRCAAESSNSAASINSMLR